MIDWKDPADVPDDLARVRIKAGDYTPRMTPAQERRWRAMQDPALVALLERAVAAEAARRRSGAVIHDLAQAHRPLAIAAREAYAEADAAYRAADHEWIVFRRLWLAAVREAS